MKTKLTYLTVGLAAIALAFGCSMFGANPTPPSPLEAKVFNVITNVAYRIVDNTNVVTVTNVVTLVQPSGPPILTTNMVTTTNVVTQTNQVEQYQFTPKTEIVSTVQALGTASGPFTGGVGTMVGAALVALYAGWAQLRSNKNANTSTALAQEIETIREFILTLPSGTKIDQAVTQFMQQHQVEAGVAQNVLGILANNVSNNDAVAAAKELSDAIGVLSAPPKV